MADDKNAKDVAVSDGDSGEVEIIEVVAVQEDTDGPPPASGEEDRLAPREPSPDEEPDEFFLSLDDDDEADARGGLLEAPPEPDATSAPDENELIVRLRADYDNLRKRIDRERQEYRRNANTQLLGRLLPVLDNFERALGVDSSKASAEALHSGLVMIYRQLGDELRREGLEAIESVGGPFDPNLHDAVATEASSVHPPNTVIEEFQRGYLFQDQLLRPAMVKVSTSEERRSADDGSEMGSS
jgi:molecular chaperone GrpE